MDGSARWLSRSLQLADERSDIRGGADGIGSLQVGQSVAAVCGMLCIPVADNKQCIIVVGIESKDSPVGV